jgi:hypothetical protein
MKTNEPTTMRICGETMALITSQQLSQYYETYKAINVTFNKQVVRATGLTANQTFLRFLGYQIPCIIYTSSMTGAKVIASVNQGLYTKIRDANNMVSLRFCFSDLETANSHAFFVSAKIAGFSPYNKEHPDLNFITLTYTQRPSDDLIATLGQLLEANINSKKRKEERIEIDPDTMRKLGLSSREAILIVGNEPRKCILRDISFSGVMVMVSGGKDELNGKSVKLKITFDNGEVTQTFAGKVVRFDVFEDQQSIGTAGISYDENSVPMEYKMRLNDYLVTYRKTPTL